MVFPTTSSPLCAYLIREGIVRNSTVVTGEELRVVCYVLKGVIEVLLRWFFQHYDKISR
jgi:hypothetical protein